MWDVKTVTTADFTVEVEIYESVWQKWLEYKTKMNSDHLDLDETREDFYPDFQDYF